MKLLPTRNKGYCPYKKSESFLAILIAGNWCMEHCPDKGNGGMIYTWVDCNHPSYITGIPIHTDNGPSDNIIQAIF